MDRMIRVAGEYLVIAEETSHNADVIDTLMGFTVFTDVEADVRGDEFQGGVIDVVETVLVVSFIDAENTEIGPEGQNAGSGKSAAHCGGVMFLNSGLEEIIGEDFGKISCAF